MKHVKLTKEQLAAAATFDADDLFLLTYTTNSPVEISGYDPTPAWDITALFLMVQHDFLRARVSLADTAEGSIVPRTVHLSITPAGRAVIGKLMP